MNIELVVLEIARSFADKLSADELQQLQNMIKNAMIELLQHQRQSAKTKENRDKEMLSRMRQFAQITHEMDGLLSECHTIERMLGAGFASAPQDIRRNNDNYQYRQWRRGIVRNLHTKMERYRQLKALRHDVLKGYDNEH